MQVPSLVSLCCGNEIITANESAQSALWSQVSYTPGQCLSAGSFPLPQRLFSVMSPKGAREIEASDFHIMDQCCGAHHSWEWFHIFFQGLWMPLWLWGKGNPWIFSKAFDPNHRVWGSLQQGVFGEQSFISVFWKMWWGMEEPVCPSLLKKPGGRWDIREVQDSALKKEQGSLVYIPTSLECPRPWATLFWTIPSPSPVPLRIFFS